MTFHPVSKATQVDGAGFGVEMPTQPGMYDQIWLQQRWSPGLCEIDGANSPREWEERKGYGWSGAIILFKGIGLAHFTVRFKLYTSQDWLDWAAFKPLLDKPPIGKRPRAMDIWHPLLVDQGIYAVVVEDLGQPVQQADGEWVIEAKLVEYRMPKHALSKPEGAAATPVDPWDVKVQQKLDEAAEELANG